MSNELQIYTRTLLQVYLALTDTPDRCSPFDRTVARKLFHQQVSLPCAKAAFALASLRRLNRPPDALPLPPIRSLAYFLPVIEELHTAPPMYWDYCWNRFWSAHRHSATLPLFLDCWGELLSAVRPSFSPAFSPFSCTSR